MKKIQNYTQYNESKNTAEVAQYVFNPDIKNGISFTNLRMLVQSVIRSGTATKEQKRILDKVYNNPNGYDFFNREWLKLKMEDSVSAVAVPFSDDFKHALEIAV